MSPPYGKRKLLLQFPVVHIIGKMHTFYSCYAYDLCVTCIKIVNLYYFFDNYFLLYCILFVHFLQYHFCVAVSETFKKAIMEIFIHNGFFIYHILFMQPAISRSFCLRVSCLICTSRLIASCFVSCASR